MPKNTLFAELELVPRNKQVICSLVDEIDLLIYNIHKEFANISHKSRLTLMVQIVITLVIILDSQSDVHPLEGE